MRLAVIALDHWYRLSPDEQRRFRSLASNSRQLEESEDKELRTLWKQLEVKRLVAGAIHVLTADRAPGPE